MALEHFLNIFSLSFHIRAYTPTNSSLEGEVVNISVFAGGPENFILMGGGGGGGYIVDGGNFVGGGWMGVT